MKRLILTAAVVFTTLTLNSCREADDVLSPDEMATLQKVKDSAPVPILQNNNNAHLTQSNDSNSAVDGEIAAPPRK